MEIFTSDHIFQNTGKCFYVNSDVTIKHLDWHVHDFLEIIFIGRGIGLHHFNKRRSWSIMQGDIFAIPRGTCHRYENVDGLLVYNIMLLPEKLGAHWEVISSLPFMQILLNDDCHKYHLPLNIRYRAEMLLKAIMAENIRRQPGWTLNIESLFYELLVVIGRSRQNAHTSNASGQEVNAVYKAIAFIEKNFSAPITVYDICKAAQINLNYFCNAFRHATGTSPWNYLILLRLEKVKKLLCETDMSIAEAAQESGFCDQSYMSRLFRKYETMTPRQFRNTYYGQKYSS